MVYTVGPQADPKGVVRQITEALSRLGMGTFAANHEFMNSQYEINLRHAPGADRRRPRVPPQERGQGRRRHPRADRHVHGQAVQRPGRLGLPLPLLARPRGRQRVRRPHDPDGVSAELRHFSAGVLAHAHALTAFLNPTINAYRRLVPDSLAPTHANWGWDNRTSFIRIPRRARPRVARRGARRRRQREPVPGDRRAALRRPARRAREAPARPARRRRRLHARRPRRAPARTASGTRSTRSRPTRCCATRWARRSSTRSWP